MRVGGQRHVPTVLPPGEDIYSQLKNLSCSKLIRESGVTGRPTFRGSIRGRSKRFFFPVRHRGIPSMYSVGTWELFPQSHSCSVQVTFPWDCTPPPLHITMPDN